MMYQEAYDKLDAHEVDAALQRINPLLDGSTFEAASTTILAQNVSFYPGYRYLEVADFASVPPKKRFILLPDDLKAPARILDFTNAPIYSLNESLPIFLNDETVEDYVRFFFAHVRGQHGQFVIVEGIDDIRWKDDPPPSARKAVSKLITPLTFKTYDEHKNRILSACIIFKDSLFKAKIRVALNGQITLYDEELMIEDIPVLDDVLGQ